MKTQTKQYSQTRSYPECKEGIISEYEEQAIQFLKKTNSTMNIMACGIDRFNSEDWKKERVMFQVTLFRGKGVTIPYSFQFWGQSIKAHKPGLGVTLEKWRKLAEKSSREAFNVTPYDVLAGMGHYYDPIFDDWANDFGYFPIKSRAEYLRIQAIHDACLKEQSELQRLYSESELEELSEIA